MNSSPFLLSPDAFLLAVPELSTLLTYSPYESAWGVTDEVLCYFNCVLLGQEVSATGWESYLGVPTRWIQLLPKLDHHREFAWPSLDSFENTLLIYLQKESTWAIRCEKDCDQVKIESVVNNFPRTKSLIGEVVVYCTGGGHECPTFQAQQSRG
ncbi:hypothetical protein V8J88_21480 [Massilia sp. W12]|uniref:hypothetical protein n=1 Tax=Massilia sp. W12 TaxID=3126507 RepID=UPI0030D341B7